MGPVLGIIGQIEKYPPAGELKPVHAQKGISSAKRIPPVGNAGREV